MSGKALQVLVADDDFFMQRVVTIVLNSLGHSGVVVDDGAKVLVALQKRRFDVVLMDVMMPTMDGLEALAAIRKNEQGHGGHQIIIMLTGHAEASDAERLMAAGADGYVAKPVDAGQLQAELERVTRQR